MIKRLFLGRAVVTIAFTLLAAGPLTALPPAGATAAAMPPGFRAIANAAAPAAGAPINQCQTCLLPGQQKAVGARIVQCLPGPCVGEPSQILWYNVDKEPSWLSVRFIPNPTYQYTETMNIIAGVSKGAPIGASATITPNCVVYLSDGSHQTCIDPVSTSVLVVAPGLYITETSIGEQVNGQMNTRVVGERMPFSVSTDPGFSLSNITWVVPNPPGTPTPANVLAVKSYPLSPSVTATVPLAPVYLQDSDLHNTTLSFYWVKPSNLANVVVKATVSNGTQSPQESAIASYAVVAPSIYLDYTPSAVGVCTITTTFNCGNPTLPLGTQFLSFGLNQTNLSPGIVFNFQATTPPNNTGMDTEGMIGMTQVVSDTVQHNATICPNWTRDEYWADHFNFYPNGKSGGTLTFTANIGAGATQTWTSQDSPQVKLTGTGSWSRDFEAKSYFMYKPAGGIWVPLGMLSWSFSGSAYYDGTTWQFGGGGSGVSVANPASELPTWPQARHNGTFRC